MIVKFHARGSGVGSGPIDYLMGKDRQREGATLDRGDPEAIMAIIDASPYAKKYTSGVLSFSEPDLDRESKDKIMSDFEKMMFPGLDADQYACMWVEHRDKDRLELNFVVPNIELQSGKRLQPWYHKRDLKRVNNWKNITNHQYKLTDPDNPLNHRSLVTPRNLPENRKIAAETITSSLMTVMANGLITNRADVVKTLSDAGFTVARETKNSISIADPDGGKNIRLKGAIYERDFKFNEETGAAIERAAKAYEAATEQRIQRAHQELAEGIKRLSDHNQRRYPRLDAGIALSGLNHEANGAQHMGLLAPDNNHRSNLDSGRPLVSGQPDSREPSHDRATKSDLESVTESNVRDSDTHEQRRRAFHSATERLESRPQLDGGQAKRNQIGEKVNDGIRVTVTKICNRISEAARAAAGGIVEQLQGFAANVHNYVSRESRTQNAGEELGAAGERLRIATEQINGIANQIAMQHSRKNDRGLSR
ncbi:relaxase/mobilization nuclease domain-containing protein [Shewanella sp. SP1W3]|uniref:Relaxase/mobilization nuclease domain-containing protein n=1 Tax=Shewanella septentrionalis TaxID=2952223 RepID=A0A9X2WZV8_9GAMM|nr:relaxase/mobilization nuclease domain-containing protein [Shewanella septentrionalis]MCT7948087.1 relaxase/mobilization nuclease domain-containing protein [Shewanella septentrionalis]